MSLAGRLTAFFLGALGLVLVGFSVTLFLLARTHLYRQVDDRLESALHTLSAAAEVHPDGVEWEPRERRLTLGLDAAEDQVRWTVHDEQGRPVDRSRNLGAEDLCEGVSRETAEEAPASHLAYREGKPWRLRQRWLQPGPSPAAPALGDGKQRPENDRSPLPPLPPDERGKDAGTKGREEEPKHAALILTAGVSLQPLLGTLWNLAAALTGLSLGLWLLAALLGRRLCRRALVPVSRMAAAARGMSAADLGQRLPGPGTGDELQDLGLAFNGLLSRLEEAFERQRRFSGDASHQIRTPLTAVLGQVEVALHRDRPAEDYRQTLRLVHQQAVQLRQIVESLLFLSRADADAPLPGLEVVDLNAWVRDYIQGWSDHRRADLRVEYAPDGPLWARVQAPLLGQLLGNLLDNACKYSAPGTAITLRLGREPGAVTMAVEDAGTGIAAEDLPHVFEPFYRSAHARRTGRAGVGLGLAVARRIAVAFGGTLRAESEPGRGSRFLLQLPALMAAAIRQERTGEVLVFGPAATAGATGAGRG